MAIPPDTTSRALAVAACVFLALFLGVSAYFVSGAAISDTDFSISQALANGEPVSMTLLLASAVAALACLIVYRAHLYAHLRVMLIVATGACLAALIPVSVAYDATVHYILAGLVFVLLYTGMLLDHYVVRGRPHTATIFLVGAIPVSIACTAILASFTHITAVSQLLYALELLSVAVKLASIVMLGFSPAARPTSAAPPLSG